MKAAALVLILAFGAVSGLALALLLALAGVSACWVDISLAAIFSMP